MSNVEPMTVIPYTDETGYEHARIWAQLERIGKTIDDYDMVVAATATLRGSSVATFNQKHFSCVAGLKVIEPGK
jgi:tRNA(fMet)-specific endonuclease VapC